MFEKLFEKFKKKEKKQDEVRKKVLLNKKRELEEKYVARPKARSVMQQINKEQKSLVDLQKEVNDINEKVNSLNEKIKKTANPHLLTQYKKELVDLRKQKLLCESSLDARKRMI